MEADLELPREDHELPTGTRRRIKNPPIRPGPDLCIKKPKRESVRRSAVRRRRRFAAESPKGKERERGFAAEMKMEEGIARRRRGEPTACHRECRHRGDLRRSPSTRIRRGIAEESPKGKEREHGGEGNRRGRRKWSDGAYLHGSRNLKRAALPTTRTPGSCPRKKLLPRAPSDRHRAVQRVTSQILRLKSTVS